MLTNNSLKTTQPLIIHDKMKQKHKTILSVLHACKVVPTTQGSIQVFGIITIQVNSDLVLDPQR